MTRRHANFFRQGLPAEVQLNCCAARIPVRVSALAEWQGGPPTLRVLLRAAHRNNAYVVYFSMVLEWLINPEAERKFSLPAR